MIVNMRQCGMPRSETYRTVITSKFQSFLKLYGCATGCKDRGFSRVFTVPMGKCQHSTENWARTISFHAITNSLFTHHLTLNAT
jgi:hypothetical protein